ncbi:MAG: hypothetical protein JW786_10120 [Desulfobacterales bacterium]|nr:hypothetical protein [Desulfobacterales bacterium]
MHRKKSIRSNKLSVIGAICAIVVTVTIAGLIFWMKKQNEPAYQTRADTVVMPAQPQPVIDYNNLEKDGKMKALMQERKAKYGVEKGIDMIVKSNESLKIGDEVVSMNEILDKVRLKRGEVIENDLIDRYEIEKGVSEKGSKSDEKLEAYGIHVVQPRDNIWNIHFKFLKNYFDRRGIALSPLADEPDIRGLSSGVGKILKFSENMVYIYNLREHQLDVNLNLIHPLSKIVVFNMGQVLSLLNDIDYTHVNRIQFDGETLWIPAEQ